MKMPWAPLLSILILCSSFLGQAGQQCRHTLVLLPQSHVDGARSIHDHTAKELEQISLSQYAIVQELTKRGLSALFSEGIYELKLARTDLSAQDETLVSALKLSFPQGLDIPFKAMNIRQKKAIAAIGGPTLSQFLGAGVESLLPVAPSYEVGIQQEQDAIDVFQRPDSRDPESAAYKKIYDVREITALNEVRKFFKANPSVKTTAIAFGLTHVLSRHQELFPEICMVTPLEFMRSSMTLRSQYGVYDFEYCRADIDQHCSDSTSSISPIEKVQCLLSNKAKISDGCAYSFRFK